MRPNRLLLFLCIRLAAPTPARASGLTASEAARASATARASELRASEAARASATARASAPRPARALAGHDHDHPVCDEEYRSTVCPEACDADTLREKCCIHEGEVATLLTVAMEAQSRAIAPRVERFEECTGGHVELVPFVGACTGLSCGGFSDLFEIGAAALNDARGPNIYDAYMTQAPDVPLLAPYVEDLSSYIHDTPQIAWTDVLRDVRRTHSVNGSLKALPFDFDFLNLLLRDDLVAKYEEETGRREPRTFEDLADFAEHFYGTDINADGTPDFGICSFNGAGPAGPQALLMQVAASKLQYLGTEQGLFFDPESRDAEPLVDNPGFREALELTRRLWMASLDSEPGGWTYLHHEAWLDGRCACYLWLTGSVAQVTRARPVARLGGNGTTLWTPQRPDGSYWPPKRVFMMGSSSVYVRNVGMRRCSPKLGAGINEDTEVHCPYLDHHNFDADGRDWVNRVPYYYAAFTHSSMSINAKATKERKAMVWDLLVYANVNALEVVSGKLGPTYLDPFRRSHLDATARDTWIPPWSVQDYNALRDVFLWAGESDNAARPLSLKNRDAFEYALESLLWQYFLDVAPCADHVDCKCNAFVGGERDNPDCGYGWGGHVDEKLWRDARAGQGSLSTDEFVEALIEEYARVTAQVYGPGDEGRLALSNAHRQGLGLAPFSSEDSTPPPAPAKKKKRDTSKDELWIAAGIGASIIMCCALLAVLANAYRRQVKKERQIEEAAAELVAKQCDEANKRIRDFQAPFACIKASDFVELGSFVQYEKLRRRNLLMYVDSVRDDFFPRSLTIFASHQWLGRDDPDPDKIQYRCICAALRDISSRGDRSLDEVYLWLDYASVPQSSRAVQRLMIMSLPCIAATVDVFLVVAPRAIHATTQQQCDVSTYHDRAWCRAEMFAHSSQRGVDVMYYATERGVRPMFPERRAKAWLARGGQSAVEDDDEALPRLSTLPRASTPTTLATIKSQEQLEPPRRASSGAATAPVPTDYNDLDKVVERVSSNSSTASSRRTMSEARTRSPGLDEAVAFAGCLDVVRGKLTCCELKHPDGAPCDREELVLPIMGLFYKIYRDRSGDSLVASVYEALVSRGSVEDFFPRYFDYETRNGTIRKPLFGDLPRAIMARIDRDQGLASPGVDRFFLPAADPLSSQPHHMQHQSHRSMHRRRRSRGSPPTPLRTFLSRSLSFRSTTRSSSAPASSTRRTSTPSTARSSLSLPPATTRRPSDGDGLPELTSLQQDVAGKKLVMDALAASDGTHALDVEAPPVSDAGARPQMRRQGSVSVDAAYRAMPAHHTPTEFDAKGSSGQSAWAGMMPDAAAAPPTPQNRASGWPGWSKK